MEWLLRKEVTRPGLRSWRFEIYFVVFEPQEDERWPGICQHPNKKERKRRNVKINTEKGVVIESPSVNKQHVLLVYKMMDTHVMWTIQQWIKQLFLLVSREDTGLLISCRPSLDFFLLSQAQWQKLFIFVFSSKILDGGVRDSWRNSGTCLSIHCLVLHKQKGWFARVLHRNCVGVWYVSHAESG